jgi:hypothetical protein
MLNFLPYKPTGPVSSNIYRPTINSTGPNLKTTLMTKPFYGFSQYMCNSVEVVKKNVGPANV